MGQITLSFTENTLYIHHASTALRIAKGSDFFRLHLDTSENRELEVRSGAQTPVCVEEGADALTIRYDSLVAEDGRTYAVGLTVNVKVQGDGVRYDATLQNRHEGIVVNEVQLPLVQAEVLNGATNEEVLYMPNALGERFIDPRRTLLRFHTEYMRAEYKNVWLTGQYPPGGNALSLSMPWLCVDAAGYSFGLHHAAVGFSMVSLSVGRTPIQEKKPDLLLSMSHYPAARCGETLSFGEASLLIFEGDWRRMSEYHRAWFEENISKNIVPDRPLWVEEMSGWQRVILKHQYGEIFFRYSDLPRLYLGGAKHGIHTLLVFGWWRGCFDNHYPEYEPDPALGGEEGLRAAIEEVHRLGGRVALYSNGQLIDVKTDYYRNVGKEICAKDIDGNEYREHYRFANNGTLLHLHGYKSFVTGCHGTREWGAQLMRIGEQKLSYGADSLFYDQFACCIKMCFDSTHLHGDRIDEESKYRLKNLARLRSLIHGDRAIGSEWPLDRFSPYIDYIHGCGQSAIYSPTAFPDLYRHTFGETLISNRLAHANEDGFARKLNYGFCAGLIFDVSIYRGRRIALDDMPDYAKKIDELVALRRRYADFFVRGKFRSMNLFLPAGVHAFRYEAGERAIIACCNNTAAPVTIDADGTRITLAAEEVRVVECW